MTREKSLSSVQSLTYRNTQYDVGDVVKFKPIEGITNPEFPIKIVELFPPNTCVLEAVDPENHWVSSCDLKGVAIVEKVKTMIVVTGEPGLGMTYLAHDTLVPSTKCRECGRTLTHPRSVQCGWGPVCFRRIFGKDQPPLPGKILGRRGGRKTSKIDLSKLTDVRDWFVC